MTTEHKSFDAVVRKIVAEYSQKDLPEITRAVITAKFFQKADWKPETNALVGDAATIAVWHAFRRLSNGILKDLRSIDDEQGDFADIAGSGWNKHSLRQYYPILGRKLVRFDLLTLPQWVRIFNQIKQQVKTLSSHEAAISTYVSNKFGVDVASVDPEAIEDDAA